MNTKFLKPLTLLGITSVMVMAFVLNSKNLVQGSELKLENLAALEEAVADCGPGDFCDVSSLVCTSVDWGNGPEIVPGSPCPPPDDDTIAIGGGGGGHMQ